MLNRTVKVFCAISKCCGAPAWRGAKLFFLSMLFLLALTPTPSHSAANGSWTIAASGTSELLYGVTYANGMFVAVGGGGTVVTSPDGTTWTKRPTRTDKALTAVTYGNNLYVIVGKNKEILTSPGGRNWTWTHRDSVGHRPRIDINGVAYFNGHFFAVKNHGAIITSPDGINWSYCDIDYPNNEFDKRDLLGIAENGTRVVVVGNHKRTFSSSDGINWIMKGGRIKDPNLYGICYGADIFVAVGEGGIIMTSPDGNTWTKQKSNTSHGLSGIVYAEGLFIAVGGSGRIVTSPDGITWTERTVSGTNLEAIAYGNGKLVAVGHQGSIFVTDAK